MLNRNFKDFKFQHKRKKNQILYISKNTKNDREVLNLIDNFLNEKYKVIVNENTVDRVKNYFR